MMLPRQNVKTSTLPSVQREGIEKSMRLRYRTLQNHRNCVPVLYDTVQTSEISLYEKHKQIAC